MEGNWSVDDLQAVEFTRASSHDSIDTDSSDTAAIGGASNDDLDGVGTWSQVDTTMRVVVGVIGLVRGNLVASLVAVVTSDQWGLEDQVTIVVNGEGITRAVNIGDTEDRRSNSDKVKGLGNSATSLSKVELVPASINFELNWATSGVMVVGGGGR